MISITFKIVPIRGRSNTNQIDTAAACSSISPTSSQHHISGSNYNRPADQITGAAGVVSVYLRAGFYDDTKGWQAESAEGPAIMALLGRIWTLRCDRQTTAGIGMCDGRRNSLFLLLVTIAA